MESDQKGFPHSLADMVVKARVKDQWMDCKVIGLSVEGVSLEVPQPLEMGELATIEMKKNQVQAEVLRCDSNPEETEPGIFGVVARLIEPNNEYRTGTQTWVYSQDLRQDS